LSIIFIHISLFGEKFPDRSFIRMMAQHKDVEESDREVFSSYLSKLEKGEKIEDSRATELLSGKYKSLMEEIAQSQFGEDYLSRMWRTDTALFLDLLKAQKLGTSIQDFNPLTTNRRKNSPRTRRQ